MSVSFPHLTGATDFPGDNIRTYQQYRNTFDYNRYTASYTYKLCNVRWTADSTDRVYWDTQTDRDNYFDNLTGNVWTADTQLTIIPDDYTKIPVPYTTAVNYNYLMLVTRTIPDDAQPLDNTNPTTTRLFYFVTDLRQVSASVTGVMLTLDYWTTYIYNVTIPRVVMQRGHAAMQYTTVTDYLANPLANSRGLTTPEPWTVQPANTTACNDWVPLATGTLYALLAVRATWADLKALNTTNAAGSSTGATFTDSATEYGTQYNVNGWQWGGVPDVDNLTTPNAYAVSADDIRPNGHTMLAITADRLADALRTWDRIAPNMYALIDACLIVPQDMLTLSDTATIAGVSNCQQAVAKGVTKLADFDLKQSNFNYPSEYAELAKLYTYPYAWLDISNGTTHSTIRIEDTTGDGSIMRRVTLAYPYLNAQTFITGVNGSGVSEYKWVDMRNTTHTTTIPDSAFHTLMSYDIPTYTLMVDNATMWAVNNGTAGRTQARANAINASYQPTQGTTNQNKANTLRTAATGQTNANTSAATAQTNANSAANTGQTNANNLANTSINNVNKSTTNQRLTTVNANDAAATINNNSFNLRSDNSVQDGVTASALTSLQNKSDAIATTGTAIGGVLTAAATGNVIGVAASIASGITGAVNTAIVVSTRTEATDTSNDSNNTKVSNANERETDNYQTSNSNTLFATDQSIDTQTTIANNNASTTRTNAANTRNTSVSNAQRTYDTSVANAKRTYDTTVTNANASWMVSTINNQRALQMTQDNYDANITDLKRSKSTDTTPNTGDPTPDIYGTRGLQVRIMTVSNADVHRYGDQLLTYGYTYDGVIEQPKLNVMRQFTYWQCEPTIYADNAPAMAVNSIRDLLETGVTVWRDAGTIGGSIYNNPIGE